MNKDSIKNIIGYKEDRIAILQEKQQKLIDLGKEISVSSLKRSFRFVYYQVKHVFIILMILLSLIMAITAFAFPELLFFNSESYKNEATVQFRDEYSNLADKSLEESLKELQLNNKYNIRGLEQNIDKSIQRVTDTSVKMSIRFLGVLFLLLGVFLWIISRLNKKIKERNTLILKTNTLLDEIVADYKLSIEEEEREINDLQKELNV